MAGVVSGISSEDRNTIGIYPLKGKVLNVRGEATKKISENKEISDIKKILGLEMGKEYGSVEDVNKSLRYGKIMVMTDQDLDGSHIKGLCINLFHSEWVSLTKIPGFISFMNTPILRAKKGQEVKLFYNEGEYQTWKDSLPGSIINSWTIKYFKGLGTSTSAEFKEYFANKKIVDFVHSGPVSDDCIDKVFNKKRPDDRKTWLQQYDKTAFLDTGRAQVPYEEFIDQEMIHFSKYDCDRSIPCMVDGLKISLRKILFAAFKRKLTSEIKVAQFTGYVSEHSSYHHGEASLNGAIVNMAQNYVGSNNINLLQPNGQFGTRLQGGDDSASERYIFTLLNPLTRSLFIDTDDSVLDYVNDDGQIVEPEFYVPIIPFCLLNGISGIGTGFSCSIPSFSPKQIIQYLVSRLTSATVSEPLDFTPYYEGFTGSVERLAEQKWLIRGRYEKVADDKVLITELPVGTWTMPYIAVLDGMVEGTVDKDGKKSAPILKDFDDKSTEVRVHITVTFPKGKLAELESGCRDANGVNAIEKLLKLTTTVSSTNMYMFNNEAKLKKYETVQEIIDEFYGVRMATYQKRKDAQIQDMRQRLVKLSMRAKYIQDCLSGKIDLRRKKLEEVNALLEGLEYIKIDESYAYLVKMPMDSVTDENVLKIMKEKTDLETELDILIKTSLEEIWLSELVVLEKKYDAYKIERERIQMGGGLLEKVGEKKKIVIKKMITKK
jgi:DNA topoisomerase-2